MKTYPVLNKDGQCFALEVENAYIGPRKISELLKSVDGVTDVCLRKPLGKSDDTHVEFRLHGRECIVWEPFGDSSRYWIGPKDEGGEAANLYGLLSMFESYTPPLLRKIIGDLLTFNFRGIFNLERG